MPSYPLCWSFDSSAHWLINTYKQHMLIYSMFLQWIKTFFMEFLPYYEVLRFKMVLLFSWCNLNLGIGISTKLALTLSKVSYLCCPCDKCLKWDLALNWPLTSIHGIVFTLQAFTWSSWWGRLMLLIFLKCKDFSWNGKQLQSLH